MELRIAELGLANRCTLFVHKAVKERVLQAKRPEEHVWQAAHRIIALGLEAAEAEEEAAAS